MLNDHQKGNQVCSKKSATLISEITYAFREKEFMIRNQDIADISCCFQLNSKFRIQEIRKKEFNVKIRCTDISFCFIYQTSQIQLRKADYQESRINSMIRIQKTRMKDFNVKIRCTDISFCFRNQTSDMQLRKAYYQRSRKYQDEVDQNSLK